MNVRKFIAATARDALHKVKELLGPDAIILSNRAIPGGVEIMAVAAGDMDLIISSPARSEPVKDDDYSVRLSSANVTANRPVAPKPSVPPLAPRPAPQIERSPMLNVSNDQKPKAEVVPAEVMEEIRSLRKMFEQHFALDRNP